MTRKDGLPRKEILTGAASENLRTVFSICEFASSHSWEEIEEKYPGLLRSTLNIYERVLRSTERIHKFLPAGKEPADFLHETGVSFTALRTMETFTDDALQDAVNALSHGGKVSRRRGIVWPDGRNRPLEDCRKLEKREGLPETANPGGKQKTPAEELAELIASAADAFDASVRQYVSDYQDAPKQEALMELWKAEKMVTGWMERMR